jgi:hypothetical protein
MSQTSFIEKLTGKVLADGVQTIDIPAYLRSSTFQVTVEAGTATAGTITPTAVAANATNDESIYDAAGDAIVITLAASSAYTFVCQASLKQLVFTPSGTNGTFNIIVSSLG